MELPISFTLEILLVPLTLITLFVAFVKVRRVQSTLKKRQKELESRVYESLILREIGERIGYELNITKILDTIIDSLNKLLPFSVVSYMLIDSDGLHVDQKIHIEEIVNQKFLLEVRSHMLDSLNQNSPKRFTLDQVRENVSGGVVDESSRDQVLSLWITPLTINSRGLGVLAVASRRTGLYHGPEMELLIKILAQANQAVNNLESVIAGQEHRLNALVYSLIDGIIMLDKDLNLIVINPAAAQFLALPKGADLTIFDVVKSLSDKIDLRTKIDEAISMNQTSTIDNIVLAERVSQILISPVKDADQKVVGTVVIFHDITAQKQLERIRNDFTAMMVHELRAPLTVVRGTTDVIRRNPGLVAEQTGLDLLKTMQNSSENMLSLVNDLLDVSKIEAGKFQIIKTPGNIAEIVKDRVLFFQEMANGKSIKLTHEVHEESLPTNFDRDRITQVLNNLLSNALKFTAIGGKIIVEAYRINTPGDVKWHFSPKSELTITSPNILIAVTDTGVGIGEAEIPNLFTKYHQLKPGASGSGLGLVITKGIVESHGGKILLGSKVNEGTSVYITLPLT